MTDKSKDQPVSEALGDRTQRPHAADGWTVERRSAEPEAGHVGQHRNDGFPAGGRQA